MTQTPTQPANRLDRRKAADPGRSDPGGADAHRRGQDERADPGDHPGRRRRDGLVLQPLREQGAAVRGRRRGRDGRATAQLLDHLTARHRRPRRGVRLQLPAHRPAAPQAARAEPGPAQQRLGAAQRPTTAWRPARGATSKPPRGPAASTSRTSTSRLPSQAARCSPSASCCTTSPTATTRPPPTRHRGPAADVRPARRGGPRHLPPAAARPRRLRAPRFRRLNLNSLLSLLVPVVREAVPCRWLELVFDI